MDGVGNEKISLQLSFSSSSARRRHKLFSADIRANTTNADFFKRVVFQRLELSFHQPRLHCFLSTRIHWESDDSRCSPKRKEFYKDYTRIVIVFSLITVEKWVPQLERRKGPASSQSVTFKANRVGICIVILLYGGSKNPINLVTKWEPLFHSALRSISLAIVRANLNNEIS